jgi:hypothetical protein
MESKHQKMSGLPNNISKKKKKITVQNIETTSKKLVKNNLAQFEKATKSIIWSKIKGIWITKCPSTAQPFPNPPKELQQPPKGGCWGGGIVKIRAGFIDKEERSPDAKDSSTRSNHIRMWRQKSPPKKKKKKTKTRDTPKKYNNKTPKQ